MDEEFIGYVEGYAATTSVDSQGDQLTPEAIEKFADDLRRNPEKRTIYFQHDTTQPMGYITDFYVDTKGAWKGLRIKVGIYKSRPDVWEMIESGKLTGFSYGAKILKMEEHMRANDNECSFSIEVKDHDWQIIKDILVKMGAKVDVIVQKAADFPTILSVTASTLTIAGLIFQLYTLHKRSKHQKTSGHSIVISTKTKKFNFEDNTVEEITTTIESKKS
jgi:HK97 family phage prohead protease